MKSFKIKQSISKTTITKEVIDLTSDQVETILRRALKLGTGKADFHWPGYGGEEGNGSVSITVEKTEGPITTVAIIEEDVT